MKVVLILLLFTGIILAQNENVDTSKFIGTWKLESVSAMDPIYPERWRGKLDGNIWILKIDTDFCRIYLNDIYYCSFNNDIFKATGAYTMDSMYCMYYCKFAPGGGDAEIFKIYIQILNDTCLYLWDGVADGYVYNYKRQTVSSTESTKIKISKYTNITPKRVVIVSPKNNNIKSFISVSDKGKNSFFTFTGRKLKTTLIDKIK